MTSAPLPALSIVDQPSTGGEQRAPARGAARNLQYVDFAALRSVVRDATLLMWSHDVSRGQVLPPGDGTLERGSSFRELVRSLRNPKSGFMALFGFGEIAGEEEDEEPVFGLPELGEQTTRYRAQVRGGESKRERKFQVVLDLGAVVPALDDVEAGSQGDEVTVVWTTSRDAEHGPFIVVRNHTSADTYYDEEALLRLYLREPRGTLWTALLIATCFTPLVLGVPWFLLQRAKARRAVTRFKDDLSFVYD